MAYTTTNPCVGCGERTVGCHAVCLRYADFYAERRAADADRLALARAAEDEITVRRHGKLKRKWWKWG